MIFPTGPDIGHYNFGLPKWSKWTGGTQTSNYKQTNRKFLFNKGLKD